MPITSAWADAPAVSSNARASRPSVRCIEALRCSIYNCSCQTKGPRQAAEDLPAAIGGPLRFRTPVCWWLCNSSCMDIPMIEGTVRGACPHDCPDTCALRITVREGRVVKVQGDPDHPTTHGALCT